MRRAQDWNWIFWLLLGLPLLGLLLGVPATLLLGPGGWSELSSETGAAAIALSLKTTLCSLAVALVCGTPLAWMLARSRSKLKKPIEALVELPVVLPPAAAGIGLLMLFGHQGWVGRQLEGFGTPIVFTTAAVILAQLFVASPLYVRAAQSALAAIDPEMEMCAHLDGASRFATFWHITLPLARRGLLSGLMLCWARALGEFGATILFAGNIEGRTQTMPLAIYSGFEISLDLAVGLSKALLLAALCILLLAKLLDKH